MSEKPVAANDVPSAASDSSIAELDNQAAGSNHPTTAPNGSPAAHDCQTDAPNNPSAAIDSPKNPLALSVSLGSAPINIGTVSDSSTVDPVNPATA